MALDWNVKGKKKLSRLFLLSALTTSGTRFRRHVPRREARCLTVVAVNCVELLGDPDEGGPAAQLLQFPRPHVGAGGPDPAQDVPYGDLHRAFVGDLHRLPLRRSGVSKKRTRRLVLTGRERPQAGNEG